MPHPIVHLIKNSRRVLVATHTHPDGDAIGSLVALGLALKALNKNMLWYNESPIPAVYRFLPAVNRIVGYVDLPGSFDTAVVLDCGDLARIGKRADALAALPVVINIDHHVTNTGFGTARFVDTGACATAEIVYRLIGQLGVPVSPEMAVAIYTGILTDTGSFRFSNTNQASFEICQEMVGIGVNPYHVAQRVYGTYSLGRIKLLNLALDSIEISRNGKLSLMTLTREMLFETGTHPEDADGLINYARRIQDVKVAALIQEYFAGWDEVSPPFHVSLRSDGSVDVAAIAKRFGGGGHLNAAGFSLTSSLADIKSQLYSLAEAL